MQISGQVHSIPGYSPDPHHHFPPTSFACTETNVYVLSALSIKKINEKIHLTTQYHQHNIERRQEKKTEKTTETFILLFISFSFFGQQLTDDEAVSEASHRRKQSICVIIKMRVLLLLLFSVYCLQGCYGAEGKAKKIFLFKHKKKFHRVESFCD